eukprot:CAMPEP_0172485942 /NCGR_PEP_ID=MMETSP1066-20121228/14227_1 /TAXON_ID=671091 /ORGANISM="Coscinodiscus wailesii, Strain CCMP2513" /LENGTH=97 /DNA_ID=CAMNT_0013251527 /DNA_START=365 /DNA_END=659 /DNA_ORIENTATION=+
MIENAWKQRAKDATRSMMRVPPPAVMRNGMVKTDCNETAVLERAVLVEKQETELRTELRRIWDNVSQKQRKTVALERAKWQEMVNCQRLVRRGAQGA